MQARRARGRLAVSDHEYVDRHMHRYPCESQKKKLIELGAGRI